MEYIKQILNCILIQGLGKPKDKTDKLYRRIYFVIEILLIVCLFVMMKKLKTNFIFNMIMFVYFSIGILLFPCVKDILNRLNKDKTNTLLIADLAMIYAVILNFFLVFIYLKKTKKFRK